MMKLESDPKLVVFVASVAVFWGTAYPTIAWWDSASYSLAAATLGLTSSPGSLLLTLLGWTATRLPTGLTTARVLALLAGLLAGVAVTCVYVAAVHLIRLTNGAPNRLSHAAVSRIGAALGALTFAFSTTLWEYATQFTPYVLSAAFTGLIFLVMLRWWEAADRPEAWRWLALLTLLFGLDFSVHRTNALLIPGAVAWMLVRRPRTFVHPVSWVAAVGGLVVGLSLQLFVMPIAAATRSPLNMFEPTTWSRFWDYVSLAQTGGGFLVELWPRKAAFWSVQLTDFLRAWGDNFLHWGSSVSVLGLLPALAAVVGLVTLWRRDRQLGLATTLVLALHSGMTVLYFNIPAEYFRSLDRHYLPAFVPVAVVIAYGTSVVARRATRRWRHGHRSQQALGVAAAAGLVIMLAPLTQLVGNWAARDASRRHFTRDFAVHALEQLPPNAIYFTVGDNDTFPVMYVQAVEGVRRDVQIVNLSLANTAWYVDQIVRRDPAFPRVDPRVLRRDSVATDSVRIPVSGPAEAFALPSTTVLPDSIAVLPTPRFGPRMLPADWVLLDIVGRNAWRRPLTIAITAGDDGLGWLRPYARLDGLFWRIVPVVDPPVNRDVLRANVIDRPAYRGYDDRSIRLDDVARIMGAQAYVAAGLLLEADRAAGDIVACRSAAARLVAKMPPDRLELAAQEIESRCRPRSAF
jgi:hypothetical protein